MLFGDFTSELNKNNCILSTVFTNFELKYFPVN